MQAAWTQGGRQAVGWRQKGGGRVGGAEDEIPVYIARVARWAFTEPRFWRPNGAPRVNLGIHPKPEVFRVPEPANPRV